jgi:hypothetical protein
MNERASGQPTEWQDFVGLMARIEAGFGNVDRLSLTGVRKERAKKYCTHLANAAQGIAPGDERSRVKIGQAIAGDPLPPLLAAITADGNHLSPREAANHIAAVNAVLKGAAAATGLVRGAVVPQFRRATDGERSWTLRWVKGDVGRPAGKTRLRKRLAVVTRMFHTEYLREYLAGVSQAAEAAGAELVEARVGPTHADLLGHTQSGKQQEVLPVEQLDFPDAVHSHGDWAAFTAGELVRTRRADRVIITLGADVAVELIDRWERQPARLVLSGGQAERAQRRALGIRQADRAIGERLASHAFDLLSRLASPPSVGAPILPVRLKGQAENSPEWDRWDGFETRLLGLQDQLADKQPSSWLATTKHLLANPVEIELPACGTGFTAVLRARQELRDRFVATTESPPHRLLVTMLGSFALGCDDALGLCDPPWTRGQVAILTADAYGGLLERLATVNPRESERRAAVDLCTESRIAAVCGVSPFMHGRLAAEWALADDELPSSRNLVLEPKFVTSDDATTGHLLHGVDLIRRYPGLRCDDLRPRSVLKQRASRRDNRRAAPG